MDFFCIGDWRNACSLKHLASSSSRLGFQAIILPPARSPTLYTTPKHHTTQNSNTLALASTPFDDVLRIIDDCALTHPDESLLRSFLESSFDHSAASYLLEQYFESGSSGSRDVLITLSKQWFQILSDCKLGMSMDTMTDSQFDAVIQYLHVCLGQLRSLPRPPETHVGADISGVSGGPCFHFRIDADLPMRADCRSSET